jgi:large subunit ribosomal protein L21
LKQLDKAMFAVVRTGGKQYRVAAGDKIVVEKIAGEAGDKVQLDDVLLAGEGPDLRSTDGLVIAAEIIAQAKADKVTVFKKRRRHNYRRKKGHRQQHTILRILTIGGEGAKAAPKKAAKAAKPAEETAGAEAAAPKAAPAAAAAAPAAEAPAPAKKAKAKKDDSQSVAESEAHPQAPLKTEGAESEMTDSPAPAKGARKTTKKAKE